MNKKIRLIDSDGKQLGIMSLSDAGKLAEESGLDLVEVNGNVEPNIIKLIDYGKFKYCQSKVKKQHIQKIKDIKIGLNIAVNDLQIKINMIEKFLKKQHKVRIIVMFKGREISDTKPGFNIINSVLEKINYKYIIDKKPKLEGKNIVTILNC